MDGCPTEARLSSSGASSSLSAPASAQRRSHGRLASTAGISGAPPDIAAFELQARDAAAELGEHVLGLEAEPLEEAGVALGVDVVGQLLVGLIDLVALALLLDHLEDLVLGDLHGVPFARRTMEWR